MLRFVEPKRPSANLTDLQKPLEHFRARPQRLRIHPLESALLWVVCAHLVLLPWALGGRLLWTQYVSLGFSLVELGLALMPRHYTAEFSGEGEFKLYTFPKLFRFGVFWTGLALLLYIVVQGLNPAWHQLSDHRGSWMEAIAHVKWLPSGVDVPYKVGGPWRVLVIYLPVWLLVCAIWVGFTRRRTLQYFFTVLAANAFLIAVFGVIQRLTSNGKIFWTLPSLNPSFFASFVYKNHAGAYFNLTLALCCGLAAWHYLRSLRRLEKSNPAGLFVFFAVLIAIDIVISFARAATILMLVYLLLALILLLIYQRANPQLMRRPVVTFILVGGFGVFAVTGLGALDKGQAWDKLMKLTSEHDASVSGRLEVNRASWDMLKDYWHTGSGAGSYQFLFPIYQQHYPSIWMEGRYRMIWEHAHNDWLEFPIELGLPGALLILASFGYLAFQLGKNYFWENPLSLLVVLGALLVLAHAWVDLIFVNPAVLTTWCALWPAVVHWTELEEKNLRP
ncbi:MAG: O-antigen ligase family protein [Verrucomicrobia bacterium]|nr:O-antigen ligase family protein [Verrucomicrobiota bacterium]